MSNLSTTILVTGGTGFVASYVILQLLAEGYTVRTTVRSLQRKAVIHTNLTTGGASSEDLTRLSFFITDLKDDAGWKEAVEGVIFVHHVASPFPVDLPKDENELIVPAREGTLRVLKAAKEAGVRRVVLTSTFATVYHGHAKHGSAFNETEWSNLDGPVAVGCYAKSKTLAEKAAWDFIANEGAGLELTTVLPVVVFGSTLTKYIGTSMSVDVRDLAALHLLAMKNPAAAGKRFIASVDDKPKSILDIGKVVREGRPDAAKKVPTVSVPKVVVRVLSWFDTSLKQALPEMGIINCWY